METCEDLWEYLAEFFVERKLFRGKRKNYFLHFNNGRYTECFSLPCATNESKNPKKEEEKIHFKNKQKKNRKKETFRVNIKS